MSQPAQADPLSVDRVAKDHAALVPPLEPQPDQTPLSTASNAMRHAEHLFGSFDPGVGGLQRMLPPELCDGSPMRVTVDAREGGGGRSVVAARPIAAGEVVLTTEPFSCVLMPTQQQRFCAVCLSRVPGRVPTQVAGPPVRIRSCAGGCGWAVYCSDGCESSADASWHRQFECRGARSIASAKASDDTKLLARLVLQTLLRGAYTQGSPAGWYDGILLLESHAVHRNKEQQRDDKVLVNLVCEALRVHRAVPSPAEPTGQIDASARFDFACVPELRKMLLALVCAVRCNNFGVFEGAGDCGTAKGRGVSVAQAVYPAASFFNHSCSPNITRATEGRRLVLRASRPIEKGGALCIMYGELAHRTHSERQRHLREHYCFDCKCQRCVKEAGRGGEGKHTRAPARHKHTR